MSVRYAIFECRALDALSAVVAASLVLLEGHLQRESHLAIRDDVAGVFRVVRLVKLGVNLPVQVSSQERLHAGRRGHRLGEGAGGVEEEEEEGGCVEAPHGG